MLISIRHRFLFLHNYKAAGSSVTRALRPFAYEDPAVILVTWNLHTGRPRLDTAVDWALRKSRLFRRFKHHETARDLERMLPPSHWKHFFKFGFVRNPWDWQVSLYHYMLERPDHRQHQLVKSMSGFDEYIRWRVSEDLHLQQDFFKDSSGTLCVDYLGKLETIDEDFREICLRIGVAASLPHANRSAHSPYREYYDDRTRQLVADAFAPDIERFDYSF